MNLDISATIDLFGLLVGLTLTLFVFSYILGDNILFRLAMHLFIGAAAGYSSVVAWYNVIMPQLFQPMLELGNDWMRWLLLAIPWILSLLLLTKTTRRFSNLGSPVMAFLLGVGMATAMGGGVTGTLLPQIRASISVFDPVKLPLSPGNQFPETFPSGITLIGYLNAVIILLATLSTLVYFQFNRKTTSLESQEEVGWLEGMAWIGKLSIAAALGVLFAGVLIASFSALAERVSFLLFSLMMLIRT